MPSAFDHLKNIKWGLGYLLSATAWAIALVTTIQAYLGGTEYQSPLLYTLLAVTVATMGVGIIAAGVSATVGTPTDRQVSETATAAYVFANAAGTLATLTGHFFETWETGWRTHEVGGDDALTLILGLLSLPPEVFFNTYLALTGFFALLSFPLVLWGAHLSIGKRVASAGELASVGGVSLLLLIVGLLIGTPWAPVDADTRVAMSLYGTGLHILTLAVIALGFFVYAVLLVVALGRFAVVFSLSSIRFGTKLTSQETLAVAGRVALQFFYGLLGGVAGISVIFFAWAVGTPLITSLPALSEGARDRFAEASTRGFIDAAFSIGWTLPLAAAVLLVRVFGTTATKALWQIVVWMFSAILVAIRFAFAAVAFVVGVVVEAFKASRRLVDWLVRPKAKPAPSEPSQSHQRSLFGLWTRFAPKLSLPKIDWGSVGKAVAALAVLAAVGTGGVLAFNVVRGWFPPAPDRPAEEQTAATTEGAAPQPPPGFEFSTPREVSICEAPAGGLNWVNASEDRLEIALEDCALPDVIRNAKNGVLVVVSVSSFSGNQAQEIQRALRRARALAQWASFRTPTGMPVYVLNLGMARSERAFSVGWRSFGRVRGVRPALGLLLTPYPEGSTVPLSNVIEELGNGLRFARVSSSFTNCELYRFDAGALVSEPLEPVSDFDCQSM